MSRRISFSLRTLFFAVTLLACGLAAFVFFKREPISNAALYSATCHRQDWEQLVQSLPKSVENGIATYSSFSQKDPSELIDQFSTVPFLWPKIELSDLHSPDRETRTGTMLTRVRPIDRPVDGVGKSYDPGMVREMVAIGGALERAKYSRRYYLNFDLTLRTTTMAAMNVPGNQELRSSTHSIRYAGSPAGELIVFAIPLDNELVHLLIIDLADTTAAKP